MSTRTSAKNRRRILGDFRLMFGRYRGKPIHSIPLDYLRWAESAHGEIPLQDRWAITQYLKESDGHRQKKRRGRSPRTEVATRRQQSGSQSQNAPTTETGERARLAGGLPA